jgi:hypothetical protein
MTHPRKQLLYIVLSLADLSLTCWLLGRSGGHLYEANPVAQWWLARHGWLGLVGFKGGAVALVLGLTLWIAQSRPRAAARILELACAVSALVVLYSAALIPAATRSPEERAAEVRRDVIQQLEKENRAALTSYQQREVFWALLAQMSEDLIAGRRTLGEAAECVVALEYGRTFASQRARSGQHAEVVAAFLINRVILSLNEDPVTARRLAFQLEQEFRITYGSYPPRTFRVPSQDTILEDGQTTDVPDT